MREDLTQTFPVLHPDVSVLEAVRHIVDHQAVGLLVSDGGGGPATFVPAQEVLRAAVPEYVLEDPMLARLIDEKDVGELVDTAAARKLGDVIAADDSWARDVATVDARATLLEVAVELIRRKAIVAQVDPGPGEAPTFITLPTVLRGLFADESTKHNDDSSAN